MDALIGKKLGAYEIVELLGKGGMATVYSALQPAVDRMVAIKVIKADLVESEEFATRFNREVRTIGSLSHAHILKVFDFGQDDGLCYMVMELLSGGSLAENLRSNGPMQPAVVGDILGQIASALDFAHKKGIIHRDIKPSNILFDEVGNAFLTDFGIVKHLGAASTGLTLSGQPMGTPLYMPPEQWRNESIDSRADVYSLGIMIFEMLTGKVPFVADTPYGLMNQHLYEDPSSMRKLRRDLPAALAVRLDDVIARAMAKNPRERFQSAGEVAKAFKAVLAGQPLVVSHQKAKEVEADATAVESYVVFEPPVKAKTFPRRPILPLGIAMAVVAMVVLGVVFFGGSDSGTQSNQSVVVKPISTLPQLIILPTNTPNSPTKANTATMKPTSVPTLVQPTSTALPSSTPTLKPATATQTATTVPPTQTPSQVPTTNMSTPVGTATQQPTTEPTSTVAPSIAPTLTGTPVRLNPTVAALLTISAPLVAPTPIALQLKAGGGYVRKGPGEVYLSLRTLLPTSKELPSAEILGMGPAGYGDWYLIQWKDQSGEYQQGWIRSSATLNTTSMIQVVIGSDKIPPKAPGNLLPIGTRIKWTTNPPQTFSPLGDGSGKSCNLWIATIVGYEYRKWSSGEGWTFNVAHPCQDGTTWPSWAGVNSSRIFVR